MIQLSRNNRTLILLATFATTGLASLYFGFFHFAPIDAERNVRFLGYWSILALLATFACLSAKHIRTAFPQAAMRPSNWMIAALCVLAAIFLYTKTGPGFKIYFDEHTLSNTARTLHLDRQADIRSSSHIDFPQQSTIDKRPLLYSTLVATAHDLLGYNVHNAFHVNLVLTGAFLGLLYATVARIHSRTAGLIAVFFACCSPVIEQNSSGGGFEILNLVGILTCAAIGMRYWSDPRSDELLSLLAVSTALFSHVRYESPILVAPAAALIIANWMRIREIRITPSLALCPLFFLTIAWQHVYVANNEAFAQYKYDDAGFFSPAYWFRNFGHMVSFFFSHDKFSLNAPVVYVVGLAALIAFVALCGTRYTKWIQKRSELPVILLYAGMVLLHISLILCFTYGQLDDPIVTRLGLPFLLLLTICASIGTAHLFKLGSKARTASIALLIGSALFANHSYASRRYTSNNVFIERTERMLAFARDQGLKNNLYVSRYTQLYELHDMHNIGLDRALASIKNVQLHRAIGTYDEIIVVQHGRIDFTEGKPMEVLLEGNELAPAYELETLEQFSAIPYHFTRISRVTGIHPDRVEEVPIRFGHSSDYYYVQVPDPDRIAWSKSLP